MASAEYQLTIPDQTLNGSAFPARASRPTRPKRLICSNQYCIFNYWVAIAILTAIAQYVVMFLYRPETPNFSISFAKIISFNFTNTTGDFPISSVNSHMALFISSRNPSKLIFFYDPIKIDVFSSGVYLGSGFFPAFVHGTKNVTWIRVSISTDGPINLNPDSAASLQSSLKNDKLPLEITLATEAKIKMGSWTTENVGIQVFCHGIHIPIHLKSECDVKVQKIKIWKFNISVFPSKLFF